MPKAVRRERVAWVKYMRYSGTWPLLLWGTVFSHGAAAQFRGELCASERTHPLEEGHSAYISKTDISWLRRKSTLSTSTLLMAAGASASVPKAVFVIHHRNVRSERAV